MKACLFVLVCVLVCGCVCECVLQVGLFIWVSIVQGAEESELPVPSNAGPESAERAAIPSDTVSPSANVQHPSAAVAPSTITVDNASILASLRMV